MAGFVRQSKLRNVFGQSFKKDQCYDSIRVSKNSNTHLFCAVNPEFVAIVIHAEGGGQFMVLTHQESGRVDMNHPAIMGHKAAVIDIAWSPFDDRLIASCDDNGCIMIWEVPEGGLTKSLMEEDALVCVQEHQKRCNLLKWHPLAGNIILSCGADNKIILWNMDEGSVVSEYQGASLPQDLCWSPDGKTFASVSKDKVIRIHDGRTCEVLKEVPGHASPRDMRVCLLKGNRLLSTGFSRDSRREYHLWDLSNCNEPIYEDGLDQTNAALNIFYDPDLSMIYLVGKGDSVFRYYEVNDVEPYFHYITTYQSSQPQRGMGFMPKRGCNVNACEVARFYKVNVGSGSVGSIEPISMIVPRKSELFQDDIYPDTASNEPSLTSDEWLGGQNATCKTLSMKQFYVEKDASSGSKGGLKKGGLKKGGLKKDEPKATKVEPKAAPTSSVKAPAPAASTPSSFKSQSQSKEMQDLIAEIASLKATVAEQEKRIAALEAR